MAVAGCCAGKILFSSAFLITVVYEMMISMSEHTQQTYQGGGGVKVGGEGGDN